MVRGVVFLLGLLAAASAAAQDGPLAFQATTHDFGAVAEDEVSVTFAFVNVGEHPLRIVAVQPSCGCTVPRYSEGAVAPGEVGEVEVAYDATRRSGPFRQSVRVIADAAGTEVVETLRISGTAVPAWTRTGVAHGSVLFDATAADLGVVPLAEDFRQSFRMLHSGRFPLRMMAVDVAPEEVDVRFPRRAVYRDDVVQIVVEIPAGTLTAGPFEAVVRLETDDEAEPVKVLRLTGRAE